MKLASVSVLLAVLPALAQGQSGAQPNEANAWLPQIPTAEAIQQMPAQELGAARLAIKRVMLQRIIRLKSERRRLTKENSQACAQRAAELKAPDALVQLLQIEATEDLTGRDLYEHQQALHKLVLSYGVDALQMRLFVEGLPFTTDELYDIAGWLPLESVFNMVSLDTNTAEEDINFQLTTVADTYARMADVYEAVSDRAQADAAAQELLVTLPLVDATYPVRLMLQQKDARTLQLYERLVQPVLQRFVPIRRRLMESDFYGSRRLAAVDYLLI